VGVEVVVGETVAGCALPLAHCLPWKPAKGAEEGQGFIFPGSWRRPFTPWWPGAAWKEGQGFGASIVGHQT
jgi:hypothetical protein